MANQSGKRYVCGTCNTEMLVTRAGDGALRCCGQEMQQRAAAPRKAGASTAAAKEEARG